MTDNKQDSQKQTQKKEPAKGKSKTTKAAKTSASTKAAASEDKKNTNKSGKKSAPKKKKKKAATKKKTKAKKTKTSTRRKKSTSKTTTPKSTFPVTSWPSQFTTLEDLMTKSPYNFDKLAQQATSSGKEQMEALVESGNVFAKGFEDIFKTYISFAQETAEKNSQAFKDLMSCKTLDEFSEAQSKAASESLDDFFNGFIKLSEMSVKLTTEAFEPINDQFSKTVEKAKKAA